MHNEDLEHPNDDFDSVSNGNGLDNDLIGNELEHENAKVSQLENKEDITENEPNDSLIEDKTLNILIINDLKTFQMKLIKK